jgi:serine/threonine protein kinase/beta-lactam-binding protein with PASTA domain
MDREPVPELVGRLIGDRYRIEKLVARGGMATVYLATDIRLERQVALKIIHPHLASDVSFREKFIREARIAAKLSHPNLVNVFDQGQDGELAFMAMEFVSGINMRDALKDFGALDANRALELFEPILSGLAAAHRAGILHRDLKPENVLLADDGRIKLGDFGLARDIDNHTGSGSLIGTVAYLSPELVLRGVADARSDVYAAGIMLFEMLTGRQPFEGEQAVQVAYQHANDSVPAPSTLNQNVPALLDELVLWASARQPAHRPSDAVELLAVVQRARVDLKAGRTNTTLRVPELNRTVKMADHDLNQSANQTAVIDGTVDLAETQSFNHWDLDTEEPSRLENLGKRKVGVKFLVATFLAVLLGGGAGWFFSSGPGGLTAIPNLVSRTVDQAQLSLAPLNAEIAITEESSMAVAKGLVIRTEPAAGSLFFGGAIKIYVSSGPRLIAAPNLNGKNISEATEAVLAAGFKLGEVQSFFDPANAGTVFNHLGSDGTKIPEGSNINIALSLGPVPAVAGMAQASGILAIETAGLVIKEIRQEFNDSIPAGQIISLVPLVEPLAKNSEVSLLVSKGPNLVTVPNMVGQTVLAAKTALEGLGLKVVVNTDQLTTRWGIVKVKKQSVAANTQLRVGDSVTISTK